MNFKKLHPNEWGRYKDGILFIEQKIFSEDGEVVDTPDYIEHFTKNPRAIFIIAVDENSGLIVGDTYGSPIEDNIHMMPTPQGGMDPRFVECITKFPTYGKQNTIYVGSTARLPEFRKKEIAIKLKEIFIAEARKEGYKFMTGFANKDSLKLNRRFGARVIHTLENWFGSGETYYQYYIKL